MKFPEGSIGIRLQTILGYGDEKLNEIFSPVFDAIQALIFSHGNLKTNDAKKVFNPSCFDRIILPVAEQILNQMQKVKFSEALFLIR